MVEIRDTAGFPECPIGRRACVGVPEIRTIPYLRAYLPGWYGQAGKAPGRCGGRRSGAGAGFVYFPRLASQAFISAISFS